MFHLSSIVLVFSLLLCTNCTFSSEQHSNNDDSGKDEMCELHLAKLELSPSNNNSAKAQAISKTVEPLRIILADDNTLCQMSMKNILTACGDKVVTTVNNGDELVKAVLEHTCDIVITDGQMPIMDGPQAVRIIRETNKTLPIFIYTASTEKEFHNICTNAGVTDIWIKPVSKEMIQKYLSPYRKAIISHIPLEILNPTQQNATRQNSTEMFQKY